MKESYNTKIFWIDLFSGAGGTTTGIHLADDSGNMKVVACVNHDLNAIESHKENHPDCLHFVEDVRDWNVVVALKTLVNKLRKEHPDCFINIWASLECTNYSKAKGGLPRDADSRTLANALFMYIEEINPDYLYIENVREFMSWGPLDDNGKPISRKNGADYIKWVNKVQSCGFSFDFRLLNAADFGAYTSRQRYFGQFAKKGLPICWPEPTHTKNPSKENGLFSPQKKWKAVRDVLDLEDEGKSIFTRKKPLSENTLKRIYAGLEKFVAGGEDLFLKKYFSGRPKGKVISVNGPSGAIKTIDGHAPVFIKRYNNGEDSHRVKSIDEPIGSLTTSNSHAIVHPEFLYHIHGGNPSSKVWGTDKPNRTITSLGNHYLVNPEFLAAYYSTGKNVSSIEAPCPVVSTKDRFNKVKPVFFIDQAYSTPTQKSLEVPAGTITTVPKHNLVEVNQHYLMNPSWGGNHHDISKPSPVIVARQDKAPMYIIGLEKGDFGIAIYEDDSDETVKIKMFMAVYGIIDIKMRMLKIIELKRIQGFPEDYVLKGTQTEQKKQIGNAVEVTQAKAITKANHDGIVQFMSKLKKVG